MTAITDFLTNDEVLDLIGERIKQRRLGINIPVDLLSEKAGVNRKTVLELESGKDIRLSSMIKILRGLNMLHALEGAFPDVLPGGEALSARGHLRIKAGKRRKNETP